jgi:glycosyltransferase involved in cell wall biosynthesis
MKISVIIPSFNRASLLKRTLDSVFSQSYPAFELIVVDDASTDDTVNVLGAYEGLQVIRLQTNRGVSAARNAGLERATGEWIALLDSDDVWAPNKLAHQAAAARKEPKIKIFHTDEIWIRNGRRVNPMNKHAKPDGWVYEASLAFCCVSPSSILMHRSAFDRCGVFDETLPACEDYDLWLRLFSCYPVRLINEALVTKYGGHEDQLSRQHWGMDRFRVKSLSKILDAGKLNHSDRAKTIAMLQRKCEILIDGARKRSNFDRMNRYQSLANRYSIQDNEA